MKQARNRSRARQALGAAMAGILAGASLAAIGCGQTSEAAGTATEANGCNGPNGCGSEAESEQGDTAKHAEANAEAK
jgi:hypothetical protein